MTNEAHTLPTTTDGTVTYTGSGTDFQVYLGTQRLNYGGGNSGYTITATSSSIQGGVASTVSGHTRRFADHDNMTADTANITFSITVTDAAGVANTFTKVQSLAKSKQGDTGTNAKGLSITSDSNVFSFDNAADTTATDDQIRVFINQQNLSGTVATSDISIDPTGQSAFNPP